MARGRKRKAKSPSAPPLVEPYAGGDVKTHYAMPGRSATATQVAPLIQIPKPDGKLELKKEYRLKGGLFARVIARSKGVDRAQTAMVTWQKAIPQPDHSVLWSPPVEAVESYVEDFIFKNLEEDS